MASSLPTPPEAPSQGTFSSNKRQRNSERATNACEACKKRRTRCTGQPVPCEACEKADTLCYFNDKLDRRRKEALGVQEQQEKLQNVSRGLIEVLKSGTVEDVQQLLSTIRGTGKPDDIARCILSNLQKVKRENKHPDLETSEQEQLSFILKTFFEPKQWQSRSTDMKSSDTSSSSPRDKIDLHSTSFDSMEDTPESKDNIMEVAKTESATMPDLNFNDFLSEPITLGNHDTGSNHTVSMFGSKYQWASHKDNLSDLPVLAGPSAFSQECMAWRNRCRMALQQGYDDGFSKTPEKVDCELLFRNRLPQDDWNFSNNACEIARLLPNMLPALRIAFALCLARLMPYIVLPNSETLAALPGVLQPIKGQTWLQHDIAISFIPIPALRKCLLQSNEDWLTPIVRYDLNNNWPHPLISTHELKSDGFWHDNNHGWPSEEMMWIGGSIDDSSCAIRVDRSTGRRYISSNFEQHCWNFQKWSIDRGALDLWPELSGNIMLTENGTSLISMSTTNSASRT